jgi:phage terminase large subunit GpA-like protein
MSTVNCPSCKQELELDDSYRDWTVRCPHCDREFVPGKQGRARRDEPEEDEEDEEDDYEGERDEYVYGYQGAYREGRRRWSAGRAWRWRFAAGSASC